MAERGDPALYTIPAHRAFADALAAGLITARGAFFDPSTAFGPDAPARVAAQAVGPTQNLAAASDASVLR